MDALIAASAGGALLSVFTAWKDLMRLRSAEDPETTLTVRMSNGEEVVFSHFKGTKEEMDQLKSVVDHRSEQSENPPRERPV